MTPQPGEVWERGGAHYKFWPLGGYARRFKWKMLGVSPNEQTIEGQVTDWQFEHWAAKARKVTQEPTP